MFSFTNSYRALANPANSASIRKYATFGNAVKVSVALLLISLFYLVRYSFDTLDRVNYLMSMNDVQSQRLFDARFAVHVITQDCGRNTESILEYFADYAIIHNDTECILADKYPNLRYAKPADVPAGDEGMYRVKYANVIDACTKGDRMLCMMLEDDIEWIFSKEKTIYEMVVNTISIFTNDDTSWDCSKTGSGWDVVDPDGNKTQCRIVSKEKSACMGKYVRESSAPCDIALAESMPVCHVFQRNFLMVQHTGATSTLHHEPMADPM